MSITKSACRLAMTLAVAALVAPSVDAAPKNGRGNITAVDWNVMQVAIRGVDGKVNTFRVRRDAGIKFTGEGNENFPNPTLRDLAPPFYVWFVYEDWDNKEAPTIQDFDVRETPRGAGRAGAAASGSSSGAASQAAARDMTVRIQKFTNASRGEFQADVAGKKQMFKTVHPNMLERWREGDLVILTVEGRNSVTNIKQAQ